MKGAPKPLNVMPSPKLMGPNGVDLKPIIQWIDYKKGLDEAMKQGNNEYHESLRREGARTTFPKSRGSNKRPDSL